MIDEELLIQYESDADPMTRFLKAAPEEMRRQAEHIIRMRIELLDHTQRVITETDPNRIAHSAAWIARHVHAVGYEWAQLRLIVERWSRTEIRPMVVRLR